jgi:hypothetical protein
MSVKMHKLEKMLKKIEKEGGRGDVRQDSTERDRLTLKSGYGTFRPGKNGTRPPVIGATPSRGSVGSDASEKDPPAMVNGNSSSSGKDDGSRGSTSSLSPRGDKDERQKVWRDRDRDDRRPRTSTRWSQEAPRDEDMRNPVRQDKSSSSFPPVWKDGFGPARAVEPVVQPVALGVVAGDVDWRTLAVPLLGVGLAVPQSLGWPLATPVQDPQYQPFAQTVRPVPERVPVPGGSAATAVQGTGNLPVPVAPLQPPPPWLGHDMGMDNPTRGQSPRVVSQEELRDRNPAPEEVVNGLPWAAADTDDRREDVGSRIIPVEREAPEVVEILDDEPERMDVDLRLGTAPQQFYSCMSFPLGWYLDQMRHLRLLLLLLWIKDRNLGYKLPGSIMRFRKQIV